MILYPLMLRLPLALRPSAALCGSMRGDDGGLGTGVKGDCDYETINVPRRQQSPLPVPANEEEYEIPSQLELELASSACQQSGEGDKESEGSTYENICHEHL